VVEVREPTASAAVVEGVVVVVAAVVFFAALLMFAGPFAFCIWPFAWRLRTSLNTSDVNSILISQEELKSHLRENFLWQTVHSYGRSLVSTTVSSFFPFVGVGEHTRPLMTFVMFSLFEFSVANFTFSQDHGDLEIFAWSWDGVLLRIKKKRKWVRALENAEEMRCVSVWSRVTTEQRMEMNSCAVN
jgi:hypothetical protein